MFFSKTALHLTFETILPLPSHFVHVVFLIPSVQDWQRPVPLQREHFADAAAPAIP